MEEIYERKKMEKRDETRGEKRQRGERKESKCCNTSRHPAHTWPPVLLLALHSLSRAEEAAMSDLLPVRRT